MVRYWGKVRITALSYTPSIPFPSLPPSPVPPSIQFSYFSARPTFLRIASHLPNPVAFVDPYPAHTSARAYLAQLRFYLGTKLLALYIARAEKYQLSQTFILSVFTYFVLSVCFFGAF